MKILKKAIKAIKAVGRRIEKCKEEIKKAREEEELIRWYRHGGE